MVRKQVQITLSTKISVSPISLVRSIENNGCTEGLSISEIVAKELSQARNNEMQAQADSFCRTGGKWILSTSLTSRIVAFATSKNVSHLDISSTALKVDCPPCGDEHALGDSLPRSTPRVPTPTSATVLYVNWLKLCRPDAYGGSFRMYPQAPLSCIARDRGMLSLIVAQFVQAAAGRSRDHITSGDKDFQMVRVIFPSISISSSPLPIKP